MVEAGTCEMTVLNLVIGTVIVVGFRRVEVFLKTVETTVVVVVVGIFLVKVVVEVIVSETVFFFAVCCQYGIRGRYLSFIIYHMPHTLVLN